MLRTVFEGEMNRLQADMLSLGSEVETNLVKCVEALVARDFGASQELIAYDRVVNERRINIGLSCLSLIATQQPMAGDMRRIAAMIEIVGELERIHDYIKGIGRISILLGSEQVLPAIVSLLPQMATLSRDMLHRSLDAFASRNADLARSIPLSDDLVDDVFNRCYREVIDYVTAHATPEAIEHANRLEWALHNLERSADRVTNICEWVVYMAEGIYVELDSEIEAPP